MERGCIHFKCLQRRGFYCCADCQEQGGCKNACQNQPEKCQLVKDYVPSVKEVREYAEERKGAGA